MRDRLRQFNDKLRSHDVYHNYSKIICEIRLNINNLLNDIFVTSCTLHYANFCLPYLMNNVFREQYRYNISKR